MSEYITSELLSDQLVSEGTAMIFGTASTSQSPLLMALAERHEQVRSIVSLHEHTACTMATGYAQASALPGVVYLTAAPGLANAISGLYNASQMRVPLIALVDQQDTQILNEDPPLAGKLCEMVSSVCKWSCELKSGAEIARLIRRAFHEALSPPRGPTLLSLPINILPRLTAGQTICPPQLAPLGSADASFLSKVARLLVDAQNPCVIVGNEVAQYQARKEAVALVEVLGCQAYGEPLPVGVNFPNNHPQYCGLLPLNLHEGHRLLQNHDVCLVLGMQTRLPARAHEPQLIGGLPMVVQINVEAALTGRSLPCHLGANADIAESLSRLRTEIQLIAKPSWVGDVKHRTTKTIADIAHKKEKDEESLMSLGQSRAIHLFRLLKKLDQMRPDKSSVVSDLSADNLAVADALTLKSSASFFGSNAGVGGYATGAAMGVQLASPKTTVIALMALNSLLQSLAGLASVLELDLPVKFLVVTSPDQSAVGFQSVNLHIHPEASRFSPATPDPCSLAYALGIPAKTISTATEIESAFSEMFASAGPYLVEAKLGKFN